MNTATLKLLSRYLNRTEMARVRKHVAEVSDLEIAFRRRLERLFESLSGDLVEQIRRGYDAPSLPEKVFLDFYMDLLMKVAGRGYDNARVEVPSAVATAPVMMAASRLPRDLGNLMTLWDHYRKTGKAPKRVRVMAKKVRRAYLDKVQSVFEKHSRDFREGKGFDQQNTRAAIQQASRAPYARAKMIVETETTFYYNRARRQIYDQSSDVTHYLFVAIRDHATTHWCRSRNGLVYKKGSAVLDRETPPVHWNCRSELLPLLAHNPRHLQLIQDRHLWRENRTCAPLPAGWNRDRVAA